MLTAIRTARDSYVVEVGCLRFQDADLAGRKNRVHVVAGRVSDDWTGNVVMRGLAGCRPGSSDRVSHPLPSETIIVGALHTD